MKPQERREKERKARIAQIIGAARTVFYEKTFDQATMADIERESSLTRGAIYYHFKGGKEEIYLTLIIEEEKELLRQFENIAATITDPLQGLKTSLDVYMDAFLQRTNPWKMHQQYWFLGYPDPKILAPELIREFTETTLALLRISASYLERGTASGIFQCPDPMLETMMIWSLITNAVHLTKENPRITFAVADWNQMKAALWERICRWVLAPGVSVP